MIREACLRCGVVLCASDFKTLQWGMETHECRAEVLMEAPVSVLSWLCDQYQEPFFLYRPGLPRMLVC